MGVRIDTKVASPYFQLARGRAIAAANAMKNARRATNPDTRAACVRRARQATRDWRRYRKAYLEDVRLDKLADHDPAAALAEIQRQTQGQQGERRIPHHSLVSPREGLTMTKQEINALRVLRQYVNMERFSAENASETARLINGTRLYRELWALPVIDALLRLATEPQPAKDCDHTPGYPCHICDKRPPRWEDRAYLKSLRLTPPLTHVLKANGVQTLCGIDTGSNGVAVAEQGERPECRYCSQMSYVRAGERIPL